MIYRATILDIDDPANQGRIRVLCPKLYGQAASPWCTALGENATPPAVGSLIWIDLEDRDTAKPVWLGGVGGGGGGGGGDVEGGTIVTYDASSGMAQVLLDSGETVTAYVGMPPSGGSGVVASFGLFNNSASMSMTDGVSVQPNIQTIRSVGSKIATDGVGFLLAPGNYQAYSWFILGSGSPTSGIHNLNVVSGTVLGDITLTSSRPFNFNYAPITSYQVPSTSHWIFAVTASARLIPQLMFHLSGTGSVNAGQWWFAMTEVGV